MNNYKYFLSLLAIAMLLLLAPQAEAQSFKCNIFDNGNNFVCLSKTASPNPATQGQPFNFTLSESLLAGGPLTFLTDLTDTLPPDLVFLSASNNGGSTGTAPPCTFTPPTNPATSSGTVTCPGPRGVTITKNFVATITVFPTQAGTFTNPAADQFNSVSLDFTVNPNPIAAQIAAGNAEILASNAQILAATNAAIAPPFQVNYFAGADGSRPDQTVRITNTGATQIGTSRADICANIYVFRADQQLAECCSCLVTPNGLRTLSVDFDLTHNPLTFGPIGEGVIKIISSVAGPEGASNSCSPATAATFATPGGTYRAWGVHNQDVSSPGSLSGPGVINQVTETPFLGSPLGELELADIQKACGFITRQGSGSGICTCGRGD